MLPKPTLNNSNSPHLCFITTRAWQIVPCVETHPIWLSRQFQMVPVSDEPLFSAKVEPQPTNSNSIPKLICVMWCGVLIPIELPLGSAEDADVAQRVRQGPSAGGLQGPVFPSQWNTEITWLRFVLTDFGSPGSLYFPSLFQAIRNACKIVGWCLGTVTFLVTGSWKGVHWFSYPGCCLQVLWILLAKPMDTPIHERIVLQSQTLEISWILKF